MNSLGEKVVLSPLDASGVGNLESEIYSSKVFKESSHQALSNGVEGVENKSVSFMIHSFFFLSFHLSFISPLSCHISIVKNISNPISFSTCMCT
jgi:hypothetical protein